MKIVLKKKVGFFRYLDLNFSYFLLYCIIFGDVGRHWHPLIGTCLSKWLETAFINWHRIDLYLCRRGLKFIVSCNQEQRLSLMLIFVKFWWLRAKIQGGWCNSQGNSWKTDSLCLWELLGGSFNLTKFHPNRRDSLCHACLLSWIQSWGLAKKGFFLILGYGHWQFRQNI